MPVATIETGSEGVGQNRGGGLAEHVDDDADLIEAVGRPFRLVGLGGNCEIGPGLFAIGPCDLVAKLGDLIVGPEPADMPARLLGGALLIESDEAR